MFWLIIVFLCAIFIVLLAVPLIRRHAPLATGGSERAALDARLRGIERDRAAGLLGEEGAEEASLEAKRAVLAEKTDDVEERPARAYRFAAFAFVAAAPLAAVWIYVSIGAPGLVGVEPQAAAPMASAPMAGPMTQEAVGAMSPEARQAMIGNMVSGLAARLEENPEDVDGWRMLARSFVVLGRNEEAARAYRELLSRVEGDLEDWRGFAGALLSLGPDDGRAEELANAIARLQAMDPDDPMALYFLGLVAQGEGDTERALAHWRRLLEVLPAEAPVRPVIEKMIADAEAPPAE